MIPKLCQSQRLTFYTLISLLLWVAAGPSHSLTKEQRADQFLLQAQEAYRDGKHRQAVEAFSRIESLGVSMPAEFHFFYGSSLAETGDHVDALRQLSSYLQLEGSDGRYYQEALRLHGKIEPKAAEAERQRKVAEAKRQREAERRREAAEAERRREAVEAERQRKEAEAERERQAELAELRRKLFHRIYGGNDWDRAHAIAPAPDGGYVVAGYTESKGAEGKDMWVVKLDDQGHKQWDSTYSHNSYQEMANAIVPAPNGGYLVAGYTDDFDNRNMWWMVKIDEQGRKQWDNTYGGSGSFEDSEARAIVPAKDGGFLAVGYTESNSAGKSDMRILKIDEQGREQWDRTYGGSGSDEANAIVPALGGGFLVAGYTSSKGAGGGDMWIVKIDEQGHEQWDRTYGGSGSDKARAIIPAPDGGYVAVGHSNPKCTNDDLAYGSCVEYMWIVKIDEQGRKQWGSTYGGSRYAEAYDIAPVPNGGYLVVGYKSARKIGDDGSMWLVRLNEQGRKQWDRTYGGYDLDKARAIIPATDGGFLVAGDIRSKGAGRSDMWIIKYDEQWQLE